MNIVIRETSFPSGQQLQIIQGDLTQEAVDAIVNAANPQLKHGGGVAAMISQRGGPQIQAESDAWVRQHGPVTPAAPAYTSAGSLACRYVIHAVGPIWGEGDEDAKLAAAVSGSLRVAEKLGLASIALPAISTGIFSFPKKRAARVILAAIRDHLSQASGSPVKQVRLTLYDQSTTEVFLEVWDEIEGSRGIVGGSATSD